MASATSLKLWFCEV